MKKWTVSELAARFNVDQSAVRRWFRSGRFPNGYKGKGLRENSWIAPERDVENFVLPRKGRRCSAVENPSARKAREYYQTYKFPDRQVAEKQIPEIIAFYRNGESQTETCIKFKIPISRVHKILNSAGIEIRKHTNSKRNLKDKRARRKMPPKEKIIELYREKGLLRDEILRQLGVSSRTFYGLLRYYEIEKRRFRGNKKATQ